MKSNLKKLFSEEIQEVITDETLTAIQEAFDSKVELSVESALIEQDNLYAVKLKTLVTTLDQDRSKKMMRVVEAVDKNNASKMVNIVRWQIPTNYSPKREHRIEDSIQGSIRI